MDALATERETIDKTNNSMLNGINTFVEDIQSEMAGVSDQIGDITSLIGAISGSMTSALSFENLKLNVFGCELNQTFQYPITISLPPVQHNLTLKHLQLRVLMMFLPVVTRQLN